MGDPRKLRKKYAVPRAQWNAERISEERGLANEYGLKNIREVWIAKEQLRKLRREARKFVGVSTGGADISALKQRAVRMGFVPPTATLDDMLSLTPRAVLDRRLQSLVFRAGLANSIKQARQLITHGYIALNGRKVTTPGMLVLVEYDKNITHYRSISLPEKKTKREERAAKTEERAKRIISEMKTAPTAAVEAGLETEGAEIKEIEVPEGGIEEGEEAEGTEAVKTPEGEKKLAGVKTPESGKKHEAGKK